MLVNSCNDIYLTKKINKQKDIKSVLLITNGLKKSKKLD